MQGRRSLANEVNPVCPIPGELEIYINIQARPKSENLTSLAFPVFGGRSNFTPCRMCSRDDLKLGGDARLTFSTVFLSKTKGGKQQSRMSAKLAIALPVPLGFLPDFF